MATVNSVNTYIVPTTSYEITKPSQPAAFAYVDTTMTNVTGDGTLVNPVQFDAEIFDQNSDFNTGTYTFTAPLTGRYIAHFGLSINGCTTATASQFIMVTSNRSYTCVDTNNTAGIDNPANYFYGGRGLFVDMDAADTAVFTVQVSGMAKTVSIPGDAGLDFMPQLSLELFA